MEIDLKELLNAESFRQHKHMKDLNVEEKHLDLLPEKFQFILYYRHCKNLTFREIDELMNKRGTANDELRTYKELHKIVIAESSPKNQIECLLTKLSPFKYKMLNETFKNNNLSNLDDFVNKFTTYSDIKSINEFGHHAIKILLEVMEKNGYTEWANKIRISNIPVAIDDSVSELSISEMTDELIAKKLPTCWDARMNPSLYSPSKSSFENIPDRSVAILYYRECRGLTLQRISEMFGMTKERVRQIRAETLKCLYYTKRIESMKFDGSRKLLPSLYLDIRSQASYCLSLNCSIDMTISEFKTEYSTYKQLLKMEKSGHATVKSVLNAMSKLGHTDWVNQIRTSENAKG